jgi:large subunit ribosomal protein L19
MANLVDKINEKQIRKDIPEIRVGDTVKANVWVKEGKKERIQAFEGIVIAKKGGSVSETITIYKKSYGIGVSRTFPINAPTIESFVVVKKGLVRRAKLNYIKDLNKAIKIKERN